MTRSLKLVVKPIWHEIEVARNKTSNFLETHGLSTESVHALTMVISELIENSIKYGCFSKPEDKVGVDIHLNNQIITAEVINPIDETAYYHLKKLDKTIQWIRGYQDPFEAYVEKLKEISRKPLNDEESGLGLVRIAYEGKAIIDFFVSENGVLNVSAVIKYEGDDHESE
jgi:hypothetical protein